MGINIVSGPFYNYLQFQRVYTETPPTYDEVSVIQPDILTVNQYYIIEFEILAVFEDIGFVTLDFNSFQSTHTFNTVGIHRFIDKAIDSSLVLQFDSDMPSIADPFRLINLKYVKSRPLPTYDLYDCVNDTIIQTLDPIEITQGSYEEDLVTMYDDYIKLTLDLSAVAEGIYYIQFTDEGVTYRTDPFNLKLLWDCTHQLTWTGVNNSDAFGFDYSTLDYTQSLRVDSKLWKQKFEYDKNENFKDSRGNVLLTYVRAVASDTLTIREMPEYCHRALWLGLKHDNFEIDGAEYTYIADDYPVQWRSSSSNAPVELEVQKQDQNLTNSNCN